jgi:hypothetical protein
MTGRIKAGDILIGVDGVGFENMKFPDVLTLLQYPSVYTYLRFLRVRNVVTVLGTLFVNLTDRMFTSG